MSVLPARRGYLVVLIAAVVTAFAQQGLPIVVNAFRKADHLTLTAMGGLVSAVTLGTLGGMILWGRLIDQWGTWRTLAVSLWVFLLPLAVLAALPRLSYPFLFVCLIGLGLGLPALPLTGTRWTVGAGPSKHTGIAISVRQAATPLGGLLAVLVLTPLWDRWPLRLLLLLVMVSLIAAASILGPILRATKAHPPQARANEPAPGIFRPLLPVLLVAGLLGSGPYLVLTYGIVTQRTGTLGVIPWLVLVEVGAVVGRIAAGWWSDRSGHIPQVLSWTTGLGVLMLAGLAVGIGVHGPAFLVGGMAWCLGVGISSWNGLVYAWAATRIASAQLGIALGWVGAATFLSVTVASPVFGWIAHQWGLGFGWALTAGAFAMAGIISLIAGQRARRQPV